MMQFTWKASERNYTIENSVVNTTLCSCHPLQSTLAKPYNAFGNRNNLVNAFEGLDPLSQMTSGTLDSPETPEDLMSNVNANQSILKYWSLQKQLILSNFTTSEKLTINTISLGNKETVVKNSCTVSEKVKHRLEQLDELEEGSLKVLSNLTQQEYIHHLEQHGKALNEAWETDQKVKALKIAIQCAKLLSNTDVLKFYPSQFILITDILDVFGNLVYQRLSNMADCQLNDGDKNEAAWETCNNWFYKVASIRELIPRLYIETAILPCYKFLDEDKIESTLLRLTDSANGIANPIVSIHLRSYICKVGALILPSQSEYLLRTVKHLLENHLEVNNCPESKSILQILKNSSTWARLTQPAVDIISFCFSTHSCSNSFASVLEFYVKSGQSVIVLASIVKHAKEELVGQYVEQIIDLMKQLNFDDLGSSQLYCNFGSQLINNNSLVIEHVEVFRNIWPLITQIHDINDFLLCADVWSHFSAAHLKEAEIDTILLTTLKKLNDKNIPEELFQPLKNIVNNIFLYLKDFYVVFRLEHFFKFIDLFSNKAVKIDVYKTIMNCFSKNSAEMIYDPVANSALMHICKALHDSLNLLSLSDERRQISNLISSFILHVSFKKDFEQQLAFYVNCRSSFSKLDSILVLLVQLVNLLAVQTCIVMKGSHSKKTAAFVKACIAYCFITIPSVYNLEKQLNLYLLTSQTAIKNQCYGQADSCLKSVVSCLNEHTLSDNKLEDGEKVSFLSNFLSTLLYIPDFMDGSVLSLFKEILKIISTESNDTIRFQLYINCICLLSAYSQKKYLYRIKGVDSNDVLYGSHTKFVTQTEELSHNVLAEMMSSLKQLLKNKGKKEQAYFILLIFNCVLAHGDETVTVDLLVCLWQLASKLGFPERIDEQLKFWMNQKNRAGKKQFTEFLIRIKK